MPPSLVNIYKELHVRPRDHAAPTTATSTAWARQGVLLLNTTLTVRGGAGGVAPGQGVGDVHRRGDRRRERQAATVWCSSSGAAAPARKKALIDTSRHAVIESAHPSPLSAHNGFFGSRPFSRTNAALEAADRTPIDWHLD